MRPLRYGAAAAVLAMLAGCGTEPDDTLGVQGAWSLAFEARSAEACPRGEPATCGGAASVQFEANGGALTATASGRGSCDTCSVAIDYIIGSVTTSVEGGQLVMQINACRLSGPIPSETDTTAQGETLCQLTGTPAVQARGTWRMTRLTR